MKMSNVERDRDRNHTDRYNWKQKIREVYDRIKKLQGDPHYVALGMAIGVFVAITPTIPFHTVIAIALAFILKASKPAAAIGVWFSNPVTIPALYIGSYKVGGRLLGYNMPHDVSLDSISNIFELGFDVASVFLVGGVVLGIVPAVITYFVTRRLFINIRARVKAKRKKN